MTLEEYKQQFKEDDAVGWKAIDQQVEKIYPDQEPKHYHPIISHRLGGEDPLDGISIYKSEKQTPHLHFVTYGFSELYYDEKAAGGDFSKWGFELSFRLIPFEADEGNPAWVMSMLQNIARYVFDSQKWFEAYHFMPANGPIRLKTETDITAIAFAPDPELGTIETPHGEVSILQVVGLTTAEYDRLKLEPRISKTKEIVEELRAINPLLITDLNRKSK